MKTKQTSKRKRGRQLRSTGIVGMLVRALQTAAEEAYQSEVVDTEMTESVIGENGTHASKADWIEDRIESWKHPNAPGERPPGQPKD